jgi:4-hydroxybenzoate polyprenyltransferase/phosphoserine phosphatase
MSAELPHLQTALAVAPLHAAVPSGETSDEAPVLVVDLDGTLIRSDLLHESLLKLVFKDPRAVLRLPGWLLKGKAHFKQQVASRVRLDIGHLPFERDFLAWLRLERAKGRRIVLCTASDMTYATAVAAHVQLFDAVMASDGSTNLSSIHKAQALTARFGSRGFDYAGNSPADIAVWAEAREAIVVNAPARVHKQAASVATVSRVFQSPVSRWRDWFRATRVHQWAKNLLIFLPLLGSHEFHDWSTVLHAVLAFLSFGLCASSVYLLNDLADIESDRRHSRKRGRPFASGTLPLPQGLAASVTCLLMSFALALQTLPLAFTAWLGVYLVTTLCYTFWLKRKIMVDSMVLAALYTFRVLAGAAAVDGAVGFWLLSLSMFLFFSLALVKRYSELRSMKREGRRRAPGRDYVIDDLQLVETLGIVSGFSAVLVMALYINGETVMRLYPHHQVVWLTVPALLYWISRMWLKAHRGEMHDDPVVFAMSDPVSRLNIALFFLALAVASIPS